jgi:exodeoxyribonuclease VIII
MDYYAHNKDTQGRYVVSGTAFGYLKKSPLQFRAFCEGDIKFDTPSLRIGRSLHEAVIEPGKFNQLFEIILPYKGQGIKERREEQALNAKAKGIMLVSESEHAIIKGVVRSLSGSQFIRDLLKGATVEQAFLFETEDGIPCKIKPDIYKPHEVLADLKFVKDAQPERFIRSATYSYDYDRQMAWYFDGLVNKNLLREGDKAYFIAVEKTPPFDFSIIEVDQTIIERGREKYEALLQVYRDTVQQGDFPGYGEFLWEDDIRKEHTDENAVVMSPEQFLNFFNDQEVTAESIQRHVAEFERNMARIMADQNRSITQKVRLIQGWRPKPEAFGAKLPEVLERKQKVLEDLIGEG